MLSLIAFLLATYHGFQIYIVVSIIGLFVFFGCIFFALIFLIVTFFCVKGGKCCWHITHPRGKKKEEELSIIAGEEAEYDDSDDGSFFNKPYLMTPDVTDYQQLVNEPDNETKSVLINPPPKKTKTRFSKLTRFESAAISVKSSATGYTSIEDDDLAEGGFMKNRLHTHKDFVEGTRIRFSLLYSKADLFLMLTINEVEGIPPKAEGEGGGGYDMVRVAVTMFPLKKYRSRTKYVFQNDSKAVFDECFKFSNVSKDSLYNSAFRLRVYGKKPGRDVVLGEVMVHLADVAQRAGGFMSWRPCEKVKR